MVWHSNLLCSIHSDFCSQLIHFNYLYYYFVLFVYIWLFSLAFWPWWQTSCLLSAQSNVCVKMIFFLFSCLMVVVIVSGLLCSSKERIKFLFVSPHFHSFSLIFSFFLHFFLLSSSDGCLSLRLLNHQRWTCWPLTFVSSGGEVGRLERTGSGRSSRQEDKREVRRLEFWPYLHQRCRHHFVFCLSCGVEKRKTQRLSGAGCLWSGGDTRDGCVFCGWALLWIASCRSFGAKVWKLGDGLETSTACRKIFSLGKISAKRRQRKACRRRMCFHPGGSECLLHPQHDIRRLWYRRVRGNLFLFFYFSQWLYFRIFPKMNRF